MVLADDLEAIKKQQMMLSPFHSASSKELFYPGGLTRVVHSNDGWFQESPKGGMG